MVADFYHSAVYYNFSNKQQKRIPSSVQTGSRSISQRSALQLEVTSNTNVFLSQSRIAADLYHSAVHYNCSNNQKKRIPAAVQNGSTTISHRSELQ